MKIKKMLLLISICALLGFVVVTIYDLTNLPQEQIQNPPDNIPQEPPQDHNQSDVLQNQQPPPLRPETPVLTVPLSGIMLVFGIITIAIYGMYIGFEHNFDKNLKIISKVVEDNAISSSKQIKDVNMNDMILNLLNDNERKIVKKLTTQNSASLQSEISRMDNMGKVKSHRTIKDLTRKGIVSVEKMGNTNYIHLTEDVRKLLLEKC
jgi:predicted transcriptional regulator